jgi:N-hydroxyarylamine O-acetyltransferase
LKPFDLNSYLQRIEYFGDPSPTLATLNGITEAHTKTIAFENMNVILGKGIFLSDEAIFDKLVLKNRGGYCFEQNGLLLQALLSLGFNVKPLSARVRIRFASREPDAPRTHMFLRVEIDGESFLTDVGMGAGSLTKALKLISQIEQETPHDVRRVVQERDRWYQQIRHKEIWYDLNEFTLEEMPLIDREVANWYTSTHPQSHFRSQIIAARALENGQRITLQNFEFTTRERNGDSQKRQLQNHQELVEVLMGKFGLALSESEIEGIRSLPLGIEKTV